jgi:dTDP-4-amino-4,6-dideoxygalactose transaminase
LAAGIKALGIGPGNTVLLPSYNCGTEIDPFLHLSVKPVFYKVNKDLLIDFYQPIEEIIKTCAQRNLFLIEDCAHAFLSTNGEKYLGSYGDVSIFSLLKTLPIPNGGALVINNENIKFKQDVEKPKLFPTIFYAAELLKYGTWNTDHSIKENLIKFLCDASYVSLSSLQLILAGFRKYFNPKGLYLVKPDSYLFIEDLRSWGISDLSKRIINKTNFEEVKIIRRKNFEYLLNHFLKNERGILPFHELPPGVCPLFFPIIIKDPKKRNSMYRILKSKGVVTHPWWERFHQEVPWNDFPDAVYLKQRLFGLPIHQDLTFGHLDRIIEEFEKAYKGM